MGTHMRPLWVGVDPEWGGWRLVWCWGCRPRRREKESGEGIRGEKQNQEGGREKGTWRRFVWKEFGGQRNILETPDALRTIPKFLCYQEELTRAEIH